MEDWQDSHFDNMGGSHNPLVQDMSIDGLLLNFQHAAKSFREPSSLQRLA